MSEENRRFLLAERPSGPVDENTYDLVREPVPEIGEGEALVRIKAISIDPTNRTWISEEPTYLPPVAIGEVMRALGNVVLEYRVRSESGIPQQVQGDSDRAEYVPENAVVRLFGDSKRATLRRSGHEAVTIFGRILRYHLEEGTIAVEKGLSGRSRIQTSEGGEEEPSGGE